MCWYGHGASLLAIMGTRPMCPAFLVALRPASSILQTLHVGPFFIIFWYKKGRVPWELRQPLYGSVSARMHKKSGYGSRVIFTLLCSSFAVAQPSPNVQKRISQAIAAAAHETNIDYTAFVNPFIGTGMCKFAVCVRLLSTDDYSHDRQLWRCLVPTSFINHWPQKLSMNL